MKHNNPENYDNKIKLSICIPTLNRAVFLKETLENVISEAGDNVEIVIVDGASTDNTTEMVQKLNEKFANIVYYRGETNMGVDRDMAKTIELARGDYCWMLSDDDLLKPGAINRILKEIESGCEIYLCNVTACSLTMKPIYDNYWLSREVKDRVFNLHEKSEMIQYCNDANSIGAFFSYMSSIILRREEWNKKGYNYDFDGSAYALASSLLSFIKNSCRLKYIRDSLVLWRNDNESFQNEGGLVKRFLLDFDAYLRFADEYFTDDKDIRNKFLKVMTREHPWYTIINVTSFIDSHESWMQFRNRMLAFGYNPKMIAICHALGRYNNIVQMAVKVKRKIVRSNFRRWIQNVTGLLYF
jgi:abequosyltransferase